MTSYVSDLVVMLIVDRRSHRVKVVTLQVFDKVLLALLYNGLLVSRVLIATKSKLESRSEPHSNLQFLVFT